MVGLVMLVALALYLAISIAVVRWVVRWAKRKGRRPLLWGILAGLVMYNLVFWDLIPTYAVYKYYCITKAGFWVYKTPEQWKAENPGVAETLTWRERSQHYKAPGVVDGYQLNERIIWIRKETEASFLPVGLSEELIIDVKNDEPLARHVSVGSGYIDGNKFFRFWTNWESYMPKYKEFWKKVKAFEKLGREVK